MHTTKILATLLVLIVAAFSWQAAYGQDEQAAEPPPVRVVMKDGSQVVGRVEAEDDAVIHFRTAAGVAMTIPRDQIQAIEPLRGRIAQGRYLRYDPNRTRLFFAPTARSQGSGAGYFALYQIFFPYVSIGAADFLTVGAGITLFPGSNQLFYAAPKLTFVEQDNVSLAAGALFLAITGGEGTGGAVYGVGTFGRDDAALTLGAGFAFGGGEFVESPVLIVGGEYQVSNTFKLISENYVITEADGVVVVSGGLRFFGERLAADFSLVTVPALIDDIGGFPFLPWIGFAYNFGR